MDSDAAAGVREAERGADRTEGGGQEGSTGAARQDEGHGTGRHERGLDQQGRRSNATGRFLLFYHGLTPRFQARGTFWLPQNGIAIHCFRTSVITNIMEFMLRKYLFRWHLI